MNHFTVAVTLPAVNEGDWTRIYGYLDLVPGTVLVEDPEEPQLLIPVEASDALNAVNFVRGISLVSGMTIVAGEVYAAPEEESHLFPESGSGSNASEASPAMKAVRKWADHQADVHLPVLEDA
jgi:hypothetical protein